jgi:hypothetical protein
MQYDSFHQASITSVASPYNHLRQLEFIYGDILNTDASTTLSNGHEYGQRFQKGSK